MKKLLLSSITLLLFACSILIFQVSCQKETIAQTNTGSTPKNKIIFVKIQRGVSELPNEIWTANIDGTEQQKINISIPTGKTIDPDNVEITNDGSKIILELWDNIANSTSDIYMQY